MTSTYFLESYYDLAFAQYEFPETLAQIPSSNLASNRDLFRRLDGFRYGMPARQGAYGTSECAKAAVGSWCCEHLDAGADASSRPSDQETTAAFRLAEIRYQKAVTV